AEPEDVEIDEPHRSCEIGDPIGDPVLDVVRALFRVFDEHRIRLQREMRDAMDKRRLLHGQNAPSCYGGARAAEVGVSTGRTSPAPALSSWCCFSTRRSKYMYVEAIAA